MSLLFSEWNHLQKTISDSRWQTLVSSTWVYSWASRNDSILCCVYVRAISLSPKNLRNCFLIFFQFISFCDFRRLCSADIPSQADCNGSASLLAAHNLYQSTTSSSFHTPYRHLQPNTLIGGLNLSTTSSSSSSSGNNPAHTSSGSSASSQSQAITTISNNLYSNNNNNNHLYQHHQVTAAAASLVGHNSKHSSSSSGNSSSTNHHPTPIEGLTALSSLGSSTLHLTNTLGGSGSNSIAASELGMSHWLADGGSNSGEI